jgi:uncharacterized protein with HEPN domain
MRHDPAAYLADIIDACTAIEEVLAGLGLADYLQARAVRSAVEREFIIIGEAVRTLGRIAPDLFAAIPESRRIIGFRNVLTHDYAGVDDESVFEYARTDILELRRICSALLEKADGAD